MKTVTQLVENQIVKLTGDNERLVREIPFLAQRLEDLKTLLKQNLDEIQNLREFLSLEKKLTTSIDTVDETVRSYPSGIIVG